MSITTKHTLTNSEIEKDIINALKNPPEMSKSSNGKWMIVAIIALVPLILIELIYPALLIWAVLAAAVLLTVCMILHRRRIEKASIEDFEIAREVVHSTQEEPFLPGICKMQPLVTVSSSTDAVILLLAQFSASNCLIPLQGHIA